MILVSLEEDKKILSYRFRKAPYFAIIKDSQIKILKNMHKKSKSNEFFDYFQTLKIKKVYTKAIGYKTFLKLSNLGVEIFLIQNIDKIDKIQKEHLLKIDTTNAKRYCTLGHSKK